MLASAGSTVVAKAVTDRDGRYSMDADRADRAVARFLEPFVGVIGRSIDGAVAGEGDATVDFSVERADIVKLTGKLVAPEGVAFDWADVKLLPRNDVPLVIALKEPDGLREAYWIRRVVQPSFEVRVLRGVWDLRVHRIVDAPLALSPQVNLGTAAVVLADGTRPPIKLGGFEFSVDGDTAVTVELRTLAHEEL